MAKPCTFRCSGLTPLALVAALVAAVAGHWWHFVLAVGIVAYDFRLTFKNAKP